MNWFSKSAVQEPPQAEDPNALRLVEVEKEREQVEEAFNESFHAIANHHEFGKRLVSEQATITARRAALLEERWNLLRILGRVK